MMIYCSTDRRTYGSAYSPRVKPEYKELLDELNDISISEQMRRVLMNGYFVCCFYNSESLRVSIRVGRRRRPNKILIESDMMILYPYEDRSIAKSYHLYTNNSIIKELQVKLGMIK